MQYPQLAAMGRAFFDPREAVRVKLLAASHCTTRQVAEAVMEELLPASCAPFLEHDPVGAPYIRTGSPLSEQTHLSLSDEGACSCALLAVSDPPSPLAGVGVDLADEAQLASVAPFFDDLFFFEEERALLASLESSARARMRTLLFSLKEAAVKSLADPARPAILDDPTAFDLVDLRQFRIRLSGRERAFIYPEEHAKTMLSDLHIRSLEGRFTVVETCLCSIVKALY